MRVRKVRARNHDRIGGIGVGIHLAEHGIHQYVR